MPDISAVVTWVVAFGGWGKVAYDWWSKKPKLRCTVLASIRATFKPDIGNTEVRSAFFFYLYIVNEKSAPIGLVDWECKVAIEGRPWVAIDRVYGFTNKGQETIPGIGSDGKTPVQLQVSDFIKPLSHPVSFDLPIRGWVLFWGPPWMIDKRIDSIQITLVDAQNTRHVRDCAPVSDRPALWINEVSGTQIPMALILDNNSPKAPARRS